MIYLPQYIFENHFYINIILFDFLNYNFLISATNNKIKRSKIYISLI